MDADPDVDPDPDIFDIDLQDAAKEKKFEYFSETIFL
jgi:hypothetical protein